MSLQTQDLYRRDIDIWGRVSARIVWEGGGVQKGWGVWGHSPRRKKSEFIFWCLKWSILTEITGFFFANKGGIFPPVVLSGGIRTPPGGNPVKPVDIWSIDVYVATDKMRTWHKNHLNIENQSRNVDRPLYRRLNLATSAKDKICC